MRWAELFAGAESRRLDDAAVFLARSGVPVFPCVPGAKRPLVAHGFRDASDRISQVREWWQRCPTANIGVPTGGASGAEVVDVDVKGEQPRGYDSFARATRQGLLGGWDAQIVTPSSGLHLYFPTDPARPQRSWQAARPQVDFRGDGGYVLVPPSRIRVDGELVRYRLLAASAGGTRPVDAQRLRDFLDPSPEPHVRAPRGPTESLPERAMRLARWLGERAEGERNRGLFWASCRLVEAGASPEEVHSTLGPVAERVGLSPREIETTIRSASRSRRTASAPRATPPPTADAEQAPTVAGRRAL